MSQHLREPEGPRGAEDPTSLPMFDDDDPFHDSAPSPAPPSRAGRTRSTFSLSAQVMGTVGDSERTDDASVIELRSHRSTPAATPLATAPAGTIDWALVAALRTQASEQLSARLQQDRAVPDERAEQELGRAIIVELLDAAAAEDLSQGQQPADEAARSAMAQAVFDALFRHGRLQPLVDDETVENVMIIGFDRVFVERYDGSLEQVGPVADSDAELQEFIAFLGARTSGRPFSPAHPRLHLKLEGGARLAAAAWNMSRPSVVIRRHRLQRVTLEDLVDNGSLSQTAAGFLQACVLAGKSIVVSGAQGAGKTTMVRALAGCIPTHERIGTIETEYELFLNEMPDRHPIVFDWEARPGSGERGPDGRMAGEITVDDCLYDSFRFNLDRVIVGEVRGLEILAMLKAMQSGTGSISTTHASSARAAVRKLVTCALEKGPQISREHVLDSLGEALDVVVHVDAQAARQPDGATRKHRWVKEIAMITPGERETGFAAETVFRTPRHGARLAVPAHLPATEELLEELTAHGFDLARFAAETPPEHQG